MGWGSSLISNVSVDLGPPSLPTSEIGITVCRNPRRSGLNCTRLKAVKSFVVLKLGQLNHKERQKKTDYAETEITHAEHTEQ